MSDNLRGAAWILASCVAATVMMLGVRGAASALHPLQLLFCRFVLVGAAGYLVFAEIPTSNALVGAAVIIVSTLYIAEREARRRRTRPQL